MFKCIITRVNVLPQRTPYFILLCVLFFVLFDLFVIDANALLLLLSHVFLQRVLFCVLFNPLASKVNVIQLAPSHFCLNGVLFSVLFLLLAMCMACGCSVDALWVLCGGFVVFVWVFSIPPLPIPSCSVPHARGAVWDLVKPAWRLPIA